MVMSHTAFFLHIILSISLCYIQIHENEMTDASSHNKQMEYFVGAEGFMPGIENGKL